MTPKEILISVVLGSRYPLSTIRDYLHELKKVLDDSFELYEVILVLEREDSSLDSLENWPGLRLIRLYQMNAGYYCEAAFSVGLDAAIGDVCVSLMAPFDPPRLIPEFVRTCLEKQAIVLGQSRWPERPFYRGAKNLFHFVCKKIFSLSLPKDSTYFVAIHRREAHQLRLFKKRQILFQALVSQMGLPILRIPYQFLTHSHHGNQKKYRSFHQALYLAFDVIVLNSMQPLRILATSSLVLSLLNFFYVASMLGYASIRGPLKGGAQWLEIQGLWSSFNFSILFILLAVCLEYFGRLLTDLQTKPHYFVAEDRPIHPVPLSLKHNVLSRPFSHEDSKVESRKNEAIL